MILSLARDTRPCAPNHLYHFQRWLRRPMSPLEQSVIEPIERLRAANRRLDRPTRVYVDDPGCHGNIIRDILILYMRWISTLISPRLNTCIVGRYRREAGDAIRHSFLNNQLKINLRLLENARLTPERLASYRSAGWLRRLSPNIITASAKFIDHIRGRWINNMLILDADRHGHSTEREYYGVGHYRRVRYQTFRQVLSTAAALLSSCSESITIIHGNPTTHPRSVYCRHRRTAIAPDSPAFHVLTPTTETHVPKIHHTHPGESSRRAKANALVHDGVPERFGCKAEPVKADGSIHWYVTEAAIGSNTADGPLSRVLAKDPFPKFIPAARAHSHFSNKLNFHVGVTSIVKPTGTIQSLVILWIVG